MREEKEEVEGEGQVRRKQTDGSYLNVMDRRVQLLQSCKVFWQLGVQDDNGSPLRVTAPQLLHKVVEALLCPANNHMALQVSNLFGAFHLQCQSSSVESNARHAKWTRPCAY